MEKNQIVICEDRGLISVSGQDAKDFLQNILSNDVAKVNSVKSLFSGIFTPQGKYNYEFFIVKSQDGYFLDCDGEFTSEIVNHLLKFKLRSKIFIKNLTSKFIVGAINYEKFKEIQISEKKNTETIWYRDSYLFLDPRTKKLGARIISNLEKLHLTIKKLNLKIVNNKSYLNQAHSYGIPIKGIKKLQNQLFGLEANFDEFNAIDFKKGCYVGQENTARMKLKNKIRKKLLPIKSDDKLDVGTSLIFNDKIIGKVLIGEDYPFALIKLYDPDFSEFKNKEIFAEKKKIKIINRF